MEGGIIQGMGFALMEQRIVDERLGRVMNANLEDYKIPTIRDVPEIEVVMIGEANTRANTLGVSARASRRSSRPPEPSPTPSRTPSASQCAACR